MEKEEEMERDWNQGIGKAIVREEVCGGETGGKKKKNRIFVSILDCETG